MPLLWEWWNTGNNTFAAVRNLLGCWEIPKSCCCFVVWAFSKLQSVIFSPKYKKDCLLPRSAHPRDTSAQVSWGLSQRRQSQKDGEIDKLGWNLSSSCLCSDRQLWCGVDWGNEIAKQEPPSRVFFRQAGWPRCGWEPEEVCVRAISEAPAYWEEPD